MKDILHASEIFKDLPRDDIVCLADLAREHTLRQGEYLFLLGDHADRMYVLLEGEIQTCLPLSFQGTMKDVAVEFVGPGSALGWSAFVRPRRFTLSARASKPCKLAAFQRVELEKLFEVNPGLGCLFTERVVELLGRRLFSMQALWARELQRAVDGGRLHSVQEPR